MEIEIRLATRADVPALRTLIDASVRGLQTAEYTPAQIERALAGVYGVDTELIDDGSYYVARGSDETAPAGCGGWSSRRTLYGGDHFAGREAGRLDPARDAARIRAFYVAVRWARRGVGSRLLARCEAAAAAAGFTRLEMGATLTGVPLYEARGYRVTGRVEIALGDGEVLPVVRMEKRL